MSEQYRKKLIEVALPLEAINRASAREKSIRHGHPSNLHRWWARRPLAAARAVIFAQMVDDPSSHPERFPTEESQEQERQRLFRIIEELVLWENTTNEAILMQAREEIWKGWRVTCAENERDPRAKELFDSKKLPTFYDPFAGGGALPLEAQRLGLDSHASDLNPVAVLINKAMIEIPPKFAGQPPVNPGSRHGKTLLTDEWPGTQGLVEDVRFYGQWMRDEAEQRIGHLYPKIEITAEMTMERPDLKPLVGRKLTVIAWLWARTVKSPDPAFAGSDVPLVSSFILSTKAGKEAYIEPVVQGSDYRFTVRVGTPEDAEASKSGTKLSRANFACLLSGAPISGDYLKSEGEARRLGVRMMAMVAEGERGRVYLSPTPAMEQIAREAQPTWQPDVEISGSAQYLGCRPYGMRQFAELFTSRQLVALNTFSDLVQEARERIRRDALDAHLPDDGRSLDAGGTGATAYADAVAVYLGLSLSKTADSNNALCPWEPVAQCSRQLFGRQAYTMIWDFAEANPLAHSSGGLSTNIAVSVRSLAVLVSGGVGGEAELVDAMQQNESLAKVVSTDPPYFDNVPYADLADFFYVWLRRALKPVLPDLFTTLTTPKEEELVAFAYRHQDKKAASAFFMEGMMRAIQRLARQAHPAFPLTIYYAFKQAETKGDGTASTGWETFLDAVINAGFSLSGTWPIRTEMTAALKDLSNSLASSIVLVCRPKSENAPTATRREFLNALKAELPIALTRLQHGNIAPVDLAQAAIGPGMAVYTRFERVMEADGSAMGVRSALGLLNQVLDEILTEQEGDFDAETRFAVTWFEQRGVAEGPYGEADVLARAKNTAVDVLEEAGVLVSRAGKARLLSRDELPEKWDPGADRRLTGWEVTQHLVRRLEIGGEGAAAELLNRAGALGEAARELAYRLYSVCERKGWAQEALGYNALVVSWPEIARLAAEQPLATAQQTLEV